MPLEGRPVSEFRRGADGGGGEPGARNPRRLVQELGTHGLSLQRADMAQGKLPPRASE